MEEHLSKRINIIKFISIVLVVYIHAQQTVIVNAGYFSNYFVTLISNGLARSAVPLYFMVSGFLFYKIKMPSLTEFYIKKTRTLLVPYIIWNVIIASAILIFSFFFGISFNVGISADSLFDMHLYNFISIVFGFHGEPISYQMWFVRDLIIIFIFSPLLNKLSCRTVVFITALCFTMWLINIGVTWIPRLEGISYFLIGYLIRRSDVNLELVDSWKRIVIPIYLLSLLLNMFFFEFHSLIYKAQIIIGCFFFFIVAGVIDSYSTLSRWVQHLSVYSFFVFCFHEPLLSFLAKISMMIVQIFGDSWLYLFFYIVIPIGVIFVSKLIAEKIDKRFHFLYSILVGGR